MLWDRRADEPAKAFAGFLCYRELPQGERTIDAAYEKYSGRVIPIRPEDAGDNEPAVEDGHDVEDVEEIPAEIPEEQVPDVEPEKPGVPDSISQMTGGNAGAGASGKRQRRRAKRKAPGYFYDFSRRYEWKMRAEAYDDYKLQLVDEGLRLVTGRTVEAIVDQRLRLKNEATQLAFDMIRQAREMLRWPLKKVTKKEDGGKTLHVSPAKWTKQTATRYAQIGVDLGRFGLEIKDDENDQGAESFSDKFFKDPNESAEHFPPATLPAKPGEPGSPADSIDEPPLAGAAAKLLEGAQGRSKKSIQPSGPVRPETDRSYGGNGNGSDDEIPDNY